MIFTNELNILKSIYLGHILKTSLRKQILNSSYSKLLFHGQRHIGLGLLCLLSLMGH